MWMVNFPSSESFELPAAASAQQVEIDTTAAAITQLAFATETDDDTER